MLADNYYNKGLYLLGMILIILISIEVGGNVVNTYDFYELREDVNQSNITEDDWIKTQECLCIGILGNQTYNKTCSGVNVCQEIEPDVPVIRLDR